MTFFSDGFTKNKLMLMYALSKLAVEPTKEHMTTFFGEYGLMGYFELQSAVYELEEDGFLAAVPRPYGQAYCVTPKGRETLEMFATRLPASLREEIEISANAYRDTLRRQTQFSAAVERAGTQTRRVTLRAMEPHGELMRVELLLPDDASAKHACAVWPQRAQVIYAAILKELNRD